MGSCSSANILGSRIECHGVESCKAADAQSSGDLDCHGSGACTSGTYKAKETYCNGQNSCVDGHFEGDAIILRGSHSGAGANIQNVATIEAFGKRSLENAQIGGSRGFDVYMYGYEAGDGASISCSSGSVCTLHCHGNACANLAYTCEQGSDCSLFNGYEDRKDCAEDNSVHVTEDNTVCPIWTNNGNEQKELVNVGLLNSIGLQSGQNGVYTSAVILTMGVAVVAAFGFYYRSIDKYSAYMPLKDESV